MKTLTTELRASGMRVLLSINVVWRLVTIQDLCLGYWVHQAFSFADLDLGSGCEGWLCAQEQGLQKWLRTPSTRAFSFDV